MLGGSNISVFLATSQPEVSRLFYKEILGLEFVSEDDFAIVFNMNDTELRISKVPSFTPQPFTVLDWHVPDISKAVTALLNHDINFELFEGLNFSDDFVWTAPDGVQVAWFKDPDGNMLSVSQRV